MFFELALKSWPATVLVHAKKFYSLAHLKHFLLEKKSKISLLLLFKLLLNTATATRNFQVVFVFSCEKEDCHLLLFLLVWSPNGSCKFATIRRIFWPADRVLIWRCNWSLLLASFSGWTVGDFGQGFRWSSWERIWRFSRIGNSNF